MAFNLGLGIQSLINGPLVLWWGTDRLVWAQGVALGLVAAAAQTFGKVAALRLLLKVRPAATVRDQARHGLLIGLGFAITEVSVLFLKFFGFSRGWEQFPMSYLSIWERASVGMFHIYSGGLVALAYWSGRRWFVVFVVTLHTLMDLLAVLMRPPGLSVWFVETAFSVIGFATWLVFLLTARAAAAKESKAITPPEAT